jgi:HEPN domain-containing protein
LWIRTLYLCYLAHERKVPEDGEHSHEAAELCLKGTLGPAGAGYPKVHGAGEKLVTYKDKLEDRLAAQAPRMARLSAETRRKRSPPPRP